LTKLLKELERNQYISTPLYDNRVWCVYLVVPLASSFHTGGFSKEK